jgi:hypothetical protein
LDFSVRRGYLVSIPFCQSDPMIKKNFLVILTILLTILLIAFVVYSYNKRVHNIEKKMQTNEAYIGEQPIEEHAAFVISTTYAIKNLSVCIVKSSSTWGSFLL